LRKLVLAGDSIDEFRQQFCSQVVGEVALIWRNFFIILSYTENIFLPSTSADGQFANHLL